MQEGTIPVETSAVTTSTQNSTRADKIKQMAADKLKTGKAKAVRLHTTVEDYVREHPTKCVLSALGAGVLLGLMIRR